MENHFKNVHDILVDAYGKYYDGKTIDFKKVCDLVKDELENNNLLGQNINDYPIEYYHDIDVVSETKIPVK